MIELSIVLLILSLLVGSLLVGRQIVDRAKIQRYLFELDYYEKNFHMFYDTYRTVVGHLDQKTCKKYSKFDRKGCNICDYIGSVKLSKLMESDTNGTVYTKYTSEYKIEFNDRLQDGVFNVSGPCSCFEYCWGHGDPKQDYRALEDPWLHFGWITSTYDKNTLIRYSGFNFKKQLQVLGHYNYNMFTTSNKKYNSTLPHEIDNAKFRSYLDMHNTIYTDTNRDIGVGGSEGAFSRNAKTRNNASFSSKLASELDAKVDDGRPGSGKILALKGGHAHNKNSTEDQHKAVCYDKMANEVDKAIYHSSTDLKYGCNIIKVMEDVK